MPKLSTLPAALAAAVALATLPAAAPRAQVQLPSLGESVSDDFGVGTERKLGDHIMRLVRRDPAYLDDPLLLEYVQTLWSPLVAVARRRGDIGPDVENAFAWEAFLLRDRSVNAFALPGGYVGVHLGLIALTATPDELASVLAHELSHVTQRHIARSVANSQRQSLVGTAAMLLGLIVAGRTGSSDAAQAAVVGGQAAVAQGQLNFSREMEREADRIGWGVLTGAGYSPQGVAQMFEKLAQASRLNDAGAYPYLRSHPLTVERIGDARARVDAAGGGDGPPARVLEHAALRARARVLMDPSVQALRRLQAGRAAAEAPAHERLSALYASALASLLLREPERAARPLDEALALVSRHPSGHTRAQRAVRLLQAQWMIAGGDPGRAARLLDDAGDGSRPELLLRARAALDAARAGGDAQQADLRRQTEVLQTWVAVHGDDASAWSLLSQCASALGLRLRAVRADAEASAALGDLPGAIDRLRGAQRLARSDEEPRDFIEASIIDARLRQLEAERRQLAAETRNGERRGP